MTTGAQRLIRRMQSVREAERLAKRVYFEPFPGEELYGDTVRASLQQSLVGYWPLDEIGGVRRDISGKGYMLTDNNTVTRGSGPNYIPFAAQFTAADLEYLSRADNDDLSGQGDASFTFAVWVNPDSIPGAGTFQTILQKGVAPQREYALAINNTPTFLFSVSKDGGDVNALTVTAGTPAVGSWAFIVCGHDAGTDQTFISVNTATRVNGANTSGIFNGTDAFEVGRWGGLSRFWDGRQAALGRWNKLLTAAEIAWLYNASKGRVMAG